MEISPLWIKIWLFASSLVVCWDFSFVLNRPDSMKGGPLNFLFKPYELYVTIDTMYGDLNDRFVVLQSYLNIIEVIMNFIAFFLLISKSKSAQFAGSFLAIFSLSCTFWKTVLYTFYDGHFVNKE
jgi:adiponectin receptor